MKKYKKVYNVYNFRKSITQMSSKQLQRFIIENTTILSKRDPRFGQLLPRTPKEAILAFNQALHSPEQWRIFETVSLMARRSVEPSFGMFTQYKGDLIYPEVDKSTGRGRMFRVNDRKLDLIQYLDISRVTPRKKWSYETGITPINELLEISMSLRDDTPDNIHTRLRQAYEYELTFSEISKWVEDVISAIDKIRQVLPVTTSERDRMEHSITPMDAHAQTRTVINSLVKNVVDRFQQYKGTPYERILGELQTELRSAQTYLNTVGEKQNMSYRGTSTVVTLIRARIHEAARKHVTQWEEVHDTVKKEFKKYVRGT